MKFSKALDRMLIGHQVTRKAWNENEYLCVKQPKYGTAKDVEIFKCVDTVFNTTTDLEYVLKFEDADATDWMMYKKPIVKDF